MISSPRSPSTSLSPVVAATTPSRPLFTMCPTVITVYDFVNVDWIVNMTGRNRPWMIAADATASLRVSRATLYAYVSFGRIRSQPVAGSSRERVYSRDDIDALRRRAVVRRDPEKAAAGALQW